MLDGVKYNVQVTRIDVIIMVYDEYDLENECFTGKHWTESLKYDVDRHKIYTSDEIIQGSMDKPTGLLFYLDLL